MDISHINTRRKKARVSPHTDRFASCMHSACNRPVSLLVNFWSSRLRPVRSDVSIRVDVLTFEDELKRWEFIEKYRFPSDLLKIIVTLHIRESGSRTNKQREVCNGER
jgi:hypothetical protein